MSMKDLIDMKDGLTMTLKEITDLLSVQHSKAMNTVSKMATDPEFGAVSKMDTVYNDSGQTVETYQLDKRQSIAVAARLNVALLMRVIDRWLELENQTDETALSAYTAYIKARSVLYIMLYNIISINKIGNLV